MDHSYLSNFPFTVIHILERAIIHISSAATVYLIAFFTLSWFRRRHPIYYERVIAGLLAVTVIGWREVFDLAAGQSLLKAITDWISWIVGMALAIWGITRYQKAGPS